MSAPLVVNTKDGVCWTRRTVTSGGIALYAPEGVCQCPEFVMATLPELAEHGIAGSADVLPMPVGPKPQTSEFEHLREQRDAFRDQRNDVFKTNERLLAEVRESDQARLLAENETRTVRREADSLRARVTELQTANAGLDDLRIRALDKNSQLRAQISNQHDDLAGALGRGGGIEWCDLISIAAGLVKAEARVAELEDQLVGKDRPVDEDPIPFALTDKVLEDCDHPNGYGPSGCGGCGAFAPADVEDDVRPQVRRLRALLAGQRAEAGERP